MDAKPKSRALSRPKSPFWVQTTVRSIRPPKSAFRNYGAATRGLTYYRASLQVMPDPADTIFPECADDARADYLITGNQRHFPKYWKKTKIINSRELIGIVGPHLLS